MLHSRPQINPRSMTMPFVARIALAFALSLLASGMAQQAAMINDRANGPLQALKPLAVCILLVTMVFGAVAWWRPSAISRTAAAVLAVMLIFGAAIYIFGVSTVAPGIGGNIGYMMAMLVDFYFLLPLAVAVAIHWKLLRDVPTAHLSRN
jgi:hypothetical protein